MTSQSGGAAAPARFWIQAHTSAHWSSVHLRANLFSACHSTRPSESSQAWVLGQTSDVTFSGTAEFRVLPGKSMLQAEPAEP